MDKQEALIEKLMERVDTLWSDYKIALGTIEA